ncbi:MAG: hypothetical protein ACTSQJ_10070 [Promethearchaeota archaeon]
MINWDIIAGLYNTTLSMFFFFLAFCMFYIAIKGYKSDNRYGGSSTLICGFIFIIFAYYNSIFWYLPYPYIGFMIWWIGIISGIYIVFALLIRRTIRKYGLNKEKAVNSEPDNKKKTPLRKYVELMTAESPYKENISIKMESIRKSFHFAGLLFILAYFGFFFIPPITQLVNNAVIQFIEQNEWSYNILWGDIHKQYPYSNDDIQAIIDLTMFALIATLVLAILSDLIRVIWGPEYSIFNFLTRAVLRKKEYNAAGPQIYLITGVIFSYMLFVIGLIHILIVVAGILIACFSDALAALIGRKYGNHKVKCIGGEIKSVEGFIAGAGSAFLICFFILGPIYAIIAAFIFFLLDYFPIIIADNILNPIAITIGLGIAVTLLGFPVGWI